MNLRKKVWFVVSFCIITLAVVLAASSPAAAQAAEREFIYTANFADNTVSGFSLNRGNGKTTEVPGSPFGAGVGPASITHSPDGRFVYAVMSSQFLGRPCGINNGELISYSVNPRTGSLTLVDDVVLSGVCSTGVAIDPTGKFVYAASFPADGPVKVGIIDGYQTSNGHLIPLPGTPFASPLEVSDGQNPAIQQMAIPPDGSVLYASNPNESRGILIFDRDTKTGALTFRTGFDTGSAFTPIAITSSGRFFLALGDVFLGAGQPGVFEFAIGQHGDLTPVPGSPFSIPSGFGGALAVSPNGDFVDVSVSGGVDVFRKSAGGKLSLTPGSPFGISASFTLAFDPSGRFLVGPGIVSRSNPATGALTKVSDFTPGGFVDGITVLTTCEAADKDRDNGREAHNKHDGDGDDKHDSGCRGQEREHGRD
jgi:DNA-binding beta-propeller fold protein YncE